MVILSSDFFLFFQISFAISSKLPITIKKITKKSVLIMISTSTEQKSLQIPLINTKKPNTRDKHETKLMGKEIILFINQSSSILYLFYCLNNPYSVSLSLIKPTPGIAPGGEINTN